MSVDPAKPVHVLDHPSADEEERRLKTAVSLRLSGTDPEKKRAEILGYFRDTWATTERLFERLTEEAYYTRADPLRHPLIFYFGHVACFFVNKLRLAGLVTERVNPHFESLFAIGVDEMSWDDLLSDDFEWPAVEEVAKYRADVKRAVEQAIGAADICLPIKWDSAAYTLLMGIEHERIHLETSSVLVRFLPLRVLRGPNEFWRACPRRGGLDDAPRNELLPVLEEPASVRLGVDSSWDQYVWDNEFGEQTSVVPPFKASKYLVSNREFLAFLEAGGYGCRDLWTDEGWRFAQYRAKLGRVHPPFWVPDAAAAGGFRLRLMLEEVDMPWDWPVECNQLEAKAYCNWVRAREGRPVRLPTEDEYAALREREMRGTGDYLAWGRRAPANISLEYYASSTPVDAFPPTPGGFHDVVGNVWQHTETPMDAFPGFRVHKLYDDFSVPTFDTQHNMIKGGSWISTGNEANEKSRYAFRRHFFQHAGFRYVETAREPEARTTAYERDEVVHQYCHNHYGEERPFGVENFAAAVSRLAAGHARRLGKALGSALDMGCATGRGTFELAREGYASVLGLDFSARFIRKAVELQETAVVKYTIAEEGDFVSDHTRTLVELGLDDLRDRVSFYQADACNLDPRYSGYDLVVAANLVDRLYDPTLFLAMVHERMNEGALLVVASPYSWSTEHTPREAWLGGYVNDAGARVSSLDGLRMVLDPNFTMVAEPVDVPFVLRDTPRQFQHTLSQVTVWERR